MLQSIAEKDRLKIIQITDTHLFSDSRAMLFQSECNSNFQKVIKQIAINELKDLDLILLTGDLSQDETEESYNKIVRALADFAVPIFWIPGNHDNLEIISSTLKKASFYHLRELDLKFWKLIFLNTKCPGMEAGFLEPVEMHALQKAIKEAELQDKNVALIMHHHPISVSTPLIDEYILKNNADFWDVVAKTRVKLIICGHVHNDYTLNHMNISLESGPATCFQFVKGADKLEIEHLIGYKKYNFINNQYNAQSFLWNPKNVT